MPTPFSLSKPPRELNLPRVWRSGRGYLHYDRLRVEAQTAAQRFSLPPSKEEWMKQAEALRQTLARRFHLVADREAPEFCIHSEIPQQGYRIQTVSFASCPGVRVTGVLYIPDGPGPCPAVLNTHGHHSKGKIYPRFQARGHVLAQSGFVVLSVDASGSGERGEEERTWKYHGGLQAAGLFLVGDSLMGWQIRDNQRALDLLEALPYVDAERLGVTGASGGGNQAMWLAAMDPRIKAAVPVVSVGSFEAYVGRCNCVCETLPGGLDLAEEWAILGLIAPRPLLVINSIHDQPAFGVPAMSATCRVAQEIYEWHGARNAFDTRLIDLPHGYWPPMLEAMLGWMKFWLQGEGGSSPAALPDWNEMPEDDLLCYSLGHRAPDCACSSGKEAIFKAAAPRHIAAKEDRRTQLEDLLRWKSPASEEALLSLQPTSVQDVEAGIVLSPRGVPLPLLAGTGNVNLATAKRIDLILSPSGKESLFVREQWLKSQAEGSVPVAFDLPASGELSWESTEQFGAFHDASRAAIWLGYSLPCEWGESIAAVLRTIERSYATVPIRIIAERETVFAALLALAVGRHPRAELEEHDAPSSLVEIYRAPFGSLAWIVPDFLLWGDLDDLRSLSE